MTIRLAKLDDAEAATELIYAATHDIAHFLTGATAIAFIILTLPSRIPFSSWLR